MLFEILIILFFILIVLILILIFKNIHIYLNFKNNNLEYIGFIEIDYLIFKIKINIKDQTLILKINIKNHEFNIKTFNLKKDKDDKTEVQEKPEEDTEKSIQEKIKNIYPSLKKALPDLIEIITYLPNLSKFNKSNVVLNFGLKDNFLTIKICSIIWALTAPLYPVGFELLLTPEINQFVIKSDVNVSVEIINLHIFKFIIKLLRKRNIINLIKVINDQ